MRRVYRKPPIIEALCEFRFEPSQPWDWTIPGLIYAQLKSEFPEKRQQNVLEVEVRPGAQEEITQSVGGHVERMQFVRKDGRALVQVGPDLLSVHCLRPYQNWEAFKQMIVSSLDIYRQVAEPSSIRHIGLRYINRVEIPEQPVRIADYLLTLPRVPDTVPQFFATWAQRVEIPYEQANGLLLLQAGSVQEEGQAGVAFMLDLSFTTFQMGLIKLDSAMGWIEQAHNEVENAFESCVTEKARELFEEVRTQ